MEIETAPESKMKLLDSPGKKRYSEQYQDPKAPIKGLSGLRLHLQLLLKKNYLVQKRSLTPLVIQLVSPLVICLILYILQVSANSVVGQAVEEPEIRLIEKIPQCYFNKENPTNCSTITYGIVGKSEPWIHSVVKYVAKENNLTRQNDIKYLGEIEPSAFQDYLHANSNHTQLGLIFCNSEWPVNDLLAIPCRFSRNTTKKLVFYSIIYNATDIFYSIYATNNQGPQPTHPMATSLKLSMDNAIISYFSVDTLAKGDKELDLDPEDETLPKMRNINKQEYPRSFSRFFIGVDMVTSTGALQYFVPYMISFIFSVVDIIREKDKRLRQGLAVMGMSHTAYWLSWFITSTLINLMITIITVGMGLAFGYQFFRATSVPITLLLFFLFGQALQAVAFWITTICESSNAAYTVAFSILLVSVVLQSFLTTSYITFMFFLVHSPFWFWPIRVFFLLVPSYNFAVMFGQIAMKSGRHYNMIDNYWEQGSGFGYGDLFSGTKGDIIGIKYEVPPTIFFYLFLIMNIGFYLALSWYCDHVIIHNRGTRYPWLFCIKRKNKENKVFENNIKKPIENIDDNRSTPVESLADIPETDPDVAESVKVEKERVLKKVQENTKGSGLRIIGLCKTYDKANTVKKVYALKNLFMGIDSGELLGLLGPNGAGKTTLIGALTGLIEATDGTALIDGYDIKTQMDQVREVLGVCPQFDILWDELTAEEHLFMFAKLKGIPEERIPQEIDQRLHEINLYDMKKVMTKAFSGGMKRRLSIAIALIGNPKVVFLDEPTTGMDPKNRQYIWQLIQKMKKGRAVMLTTHAMEEADALSDRIAIIISGRLRCVGTPLFLKSEYGDGYRLSLIIDKDDVQATLAFINKQLPSGRIIDCSGGSVLVGIPLNCKKELQSFIKIIEEEKDTPEKREFKKRFKDWGLRHSTLEEVFMRVSKQSKMADKEKASK